MYIVYVLRSLKDKKHYTGYTSNIEQRLDEHNAGKTKSTRNRRPFELLYKEVYKNEEEAKKREKFLKSGKGREELKKILSGAVPHPPAAGKSGKGNVHRICFEKSEGWETVHRLYERSRPAIEGTQFRKNGINKTSAPFCDNIYREIFNQR